MPRKIVIDTGKGSKPRLLTEALAEDEFQLQELVKENPNLLPIEDFGLAGPVMVVGRETGLPSGAVDLAVLVPSGDLVLIEFKTGPQNSDFRRALAQLLDYGSDCWRMTYEEFEQTVAVRYFASEYCTDKKLRGLGSLTDAAKKLWPDWNDDSEVMFRDRLTSQLTTGTMHYVLVAQRFTNTMEDTMEYLNSVTPSVNFWAVELVRFVADGMSAFESRTLFRPRNKTTPGSRIDEEAFLAKIDDAAYRVALSELLDATRGLDYHHGWGAVGTSFRLRVPGQEQFMSVAWLYAPDAKGWMGLRDLTLGADAYWIDLLPTLKPILEQYVADVARLPGAEEREAKGMTVFRFAPEAVIEQRSQITELLARVSQQINEIA